MQGGVVGTADDLLDAAQVATVLRLSRTWVYHLIEHEGLPAFRIGSGQRGRLRFLKADVEAWLANRTCQQHRQLGQGAVALAEVPSRVRRDNCE